MVTVVARSGWRVVRQRNGVRMVVAAEMDMNLGADNEDMRERRQQTATYLCKSSQPIQMPLQSSEQASTPSVRWCQC